MNANLQTLLSDLAKHGGLTLEFSDGEPIRVSGFQDGDSPFVLINSDQPDSELIFDILQKIGRVATHANTAPIPFPWLLNRPYESEFAGEVVYRTRRTLRQKFTMNLEWRSGFWALCAYPFVLCPHELSRFLKQHPEKMKLMPLVWYAAVKNPAPRKLLVCFTILYSMFVALFGKKEA